MAPKRDFLFSPLKHFSHLYFAWSSKKKERKQAGCSAPVRIIYDELPGLATRNFLA